MTYSKNTQFVSAVKYIYEHIDEPIQLQALAKNVGVSISTLKRLFIEATDKPIGTFIRRLRMELAFRTIQNRNDTILGTALRVGFDDHSAFTRCFKATFGYTPSEAREKLNIVNELESVELNEPDIIEINKIILQSFTEQGLYFESAPNAWAKLQSALLGKLDDDFAGVFIGIGHDNPHEGQVAENQVRYSAGVAYISDDLGIERVTITGGVYARFNYRGKPNNLGLAYHYIYGKWAENSPYEIRHDKPAFVAFNDFPKPLAEQRLCIHVPLVDLE
ncbi:GyrI-like domain-containing protein [Legionella sp. W05-934-2]|uniref:AraC family transcriptional regulator n=1 Tax=Legionella sp. W05-934-2 TaxID=1198649 RepID=UPI003462B9DA